MDDNELTYNKTRARKVQKVLEAAMMELIDAMSKPL